MRHSNVWEFCLWLLHCPLRTQVRPLYFLPPLCPSECYSTLHLHCLLKFSRRGTPEFTDQWMAGHSYQETTVKPHISQCCDLDIFFFCIFLSYITSQPQFSLPPYSSPSSSPPLSLRGPSLSTHSPFSFRKGQIPQGYQLNVLPSKSRHLPSYQGWMRHLGGGKRQQSQRQPPILTFKSPTRTPSYMDFFFLFCPTGRPFRMSTMHLGW